MPTALPTNGDRIRLVSMEDEPFPVDPGQTGTVVSVSQQGAGTDAWLQIDVNWDNGRTLMLLSPPDQFEIVAQ